MSEDHEIVNAFKKSKKWYIGTLLSIIILTIFAQFFIQYFIYQQKNYSHVINIAGRQRMLSQRIARFANKISHQQSQEDVKNLEQATKLFVKSHLDLSKGNKQENISPPFNSTIQLNYKKLDQFVDQINKSAQCLINSCSQKVVSLNYINEHTDQFLVLMNKTVFLSSDYAESKNNLIAWLEFIFFLTIIALVIIEVFLILAPLNIKLLELFRSKDENLALLKTIEENAAHALISCDLDGVITSFNRTAEEILGHKASDLIGKETPALFHDNKQVIKRNNEFSRKLNIEIQPGFETFICHSRAGLVNQFEWIYVHKDGTQFPANLTITNLKDKKGKLTGYLILAEDLRAKKEMEEKLENERLKSIQSSKLATLGIMAAGVAHEINNPLAIISGCSDLLSKDNLSNEKRNKNLTKITKSVMRISRIVKGLRKFARSTEGIDFTKLDLSKLVEECLILIDSKSKRHAVKIINLIQDDILITVDEIQIEQIIINLLGNAIDQNTGIEDAWVEISHQEDDKYDKIIIRDNGKGIDEQSITKLFDPFFTTKEIGKGTGLGLSISKGIAIDHGGDLDYELIGGHTAFVLRIPKTEIVQKSA